jgi:hypothetical protein
MGLSVFPAASTGGDNWVEISSQTPTSGTTVSISSISSSYKKLLLVATNILLSSSDACNITFNSVTSAHSYQYSSANGTEPGGFVSATNIRSASNNDRHSALLFITNPSGTVPVLFDGRIAPAASSTGRTIYNGVMPGLRTAVTDILFDYTASISGSNTGTIKLYGTL